MKVKSFVQRTIYGRLPRRFAPRNDLDFIYSEASVNSVAKKNIENKANVNLGKIDVSSSLTSEYNRI